LSDVPGKCTVRSRNARKKIMKPENARRAAFACMASRTTGPMVGILNRRRRPPARPAGIGRVPPGPSGSALGGACGPALGGAGPAKAGSVTVSAVSLAAAAGSLTASSGGLSTPSGSRSASAVEAR
jgi:hypothetical protein